MKKIILIIVSVIVLCTLLWMFVLTKTFLNISSDTGSFSVYKNGIEITKNQKNGIVYLSKGQYTIASTKDSAPNALKSISTNWLPWQSANITTPSSLVNSLQPQLILGRPASMVTPLGSGYIYKNTQTRGIEYVNEQGIKEISDLFGITSKDIATSGDNYTTVVNIEHDGNTVYVTTTRDIYKLTSLSDIQKSNFSNIIITRSSLNSEKDKMTFIAFDSNGTYSAYSLSTESITDNIQQVYSGKLLINTIVSKGNYALVYNDNIPGTDASGIKAYSSEKLTTPIVIDLSTLQAINIKLPNIIYAAVSIDPSGSYIAYREKMSSRIIVLSLKDTKQVAELPGTTLSQLDWKNSNLVFNYGSTLLSYDVSKNTNTSSVIISAPQVIIGFSFKDTIPVVSTNAQFTYVGGASAANIDTNNLNLSSNAENYTLSFSSINAKVVVYRLCDRYDECQTSNEYTKTTEELRKIGEVSVQDVSNEFFIGDYSYSN